MKVVCSEGGHPMIPNSTPHPHPQGVAVGGRVWYHWMSPFETNNFHYPLFFIQCIVLEIFQCLQINGPPCILKRRHFRLNFSGKKIIGDVPSMQTPRHKKW